MTMPRDNLPIFQGWGSVEKRDLQEILSAPRLSRSQRIPKFPESHYFNASSFEFKSYVAHQSISRNVIRF